MLFPFNYFRQDDQKQRKKTILLEVTASGRRGRGGVLVGVPVHTELGFLGLGTAVPVLPWQETAGPRCSAGAGSAHGHGHGLAGVTALSPCVLALGGHAVQERLGSARVSGEREQSFVSKFRLARISDALSKGYRLVTSFKSWGKISSFVRASRC